MEEGESFLCEIDILYAFGVIAHGLLGEASLRLSEFSGWVGRWAGIVGKVFVVIVVR